MIPFKKVCARFILAAVIAFFVGFSLVEAASAADTPPAAPQNLWQDSISKNDIGLSWSASISATSYSLYEWQNNIWKPVATISDTVAAFNAQEAGLSSDLRLILISDLECGTNYQFIVGARNEYGESGPSPELSTSTILCDPINRPLQISPTSGMTFTTSQVVTLMWENGSQDPIDRYHYEVYGPRGLETAGITIYTEVNIWWLPPGQYRWKIQSERRGVKGEWSDERDFTIYYYEDPNLSLPFPVLPNNGQVFTGTTEVMLDWVVANENAVGTWLEVYGPGDFLRTIFVTDTKSIQQGLEPGEYSWRTRYVTDYLMSYWSVISSFTIVKQLIPNEVVPAPTITAPISGTTAVTMEAILLVWTDVEVDGYNVEIEGQDFLQTGFVTKTSTTLQFDLPGTYQAKVQAVENENLSEWSEKIAINIDAPLVPVIDCNSFLGNPQVIAFDGKDCTGSLLELVPGIYRPIQADFDNRIESLYIPEDFSVRVYKDSDSGLFESCYEDWMWNLNEDHYWKSDLQVGNTISAVEVYPFRQCNPFGFKTSLPLLSRN